ncbi:hypothetical protein QFC19_007586 [Naganishia cerealis]|uniref:Uncharacterized protein n=1 Tax=Naganishia cerealis TaxID=610337 RepID=A0ACC2V9D5_9TREE|nr:hypothetical protein QFC19_007586 [Naganishia cerealis]
MSELRLRSTAPTPSTTDDKKPIDTDAGTLPNDHYKSHLSPTRFWLRSKLLPYIRMETDILASLQAAIRTPMLDFYFAWTANLASHTFYVLMLPVPLWFGSTLSRDLIYVLGLGIYISGNLKDYMCLPRPRSPPLHRITMSSYTAQEYGFPSSHSANATAVSLVLFLRLYDSRDQFTPIKFVVLASILFIYYFSLIFGRLYCGMHGFLDLLVGSIIGTGLFIFRYVWGNAWDMLLFNASTKWGRALAPVLVVVMYLLLINTHSEPVDDCPCFDDTVAFIGVLIGVDLAHWLCFNTGYLATSSGDPLVIFYDYNTLGLVKVIARVVLGVFLVAVWKSVSKPVVFTILPPIYKRVGVYIPRKNFQATAFTKLTTRQIRSQSISNLNNSADNIGDFNKLIRGIADHSKTDMVGPATDIDYYEMLDYKNKNSGANLPEPPKRAGVFKPRFDVEIIGRLIIYGGMGPVSVWGFALATEYLGLAK